MLMKHFTLLTLMLLTVGNLSTAWAAQRSLKQAKEIALQQAGKLGIDINSSATGGMMLLQSQADDASYYVFSGAQDGGYVIVSGDDLMPDVVAYSTSGNFSDATSMPTGFAAMLKAYDETVKAVQRGDARALKTVNEAKALRETKTFKAVDPLLEREGIRWYQEAPYYNACPYVTDDEGNKTMCLTGCVATAMAQVMRYYKYPNATIAEIPAYTSSNTCSFNMSAIPAGTKFDWDNMPGTYKDGEYTKEQADAVAQLMLACGCAVKMIYGTYSQGGSAANVYPQNLVDYFGYDKELVQKLYRDNFSAAQWTDIIDGELAAERPILYAGYTSLGGGHQFILDGADGNGLYHINWGWGGACDNYFDIAVLNPENTTAQVGDPNGFSVLMEMIIGITPDNGKVDEPLVSVPDISAYTAFYIDTKELQYPATLKFTQSERTDETSTFTFDATVNFQNTSSDVYNGYVGLGIPNEGYDNFTCIRYDQCRDLKFSYLTSSNFIVNYAFPIGTTELWPVYSTDGKTWKACSMDGNTPFMVSATATEAHVVQALEGTAEFDGDLHQGVQSTTTVTLRNNMGKDYNGSVFMYMTTEGAQPNFISMMSVSVPAKESKTITATIEPSQVGKHTFCLTDNSGNDLFTKQVEVKQAGDAGGDPSSIASATATAAGTSVAGGNGQITVASDSAKRVAVYSISGMKTAELTLTAGQPQTIVVAPGLYIVEGTKIVVR